MEVTTAMSASIQVDELGVKKEAVISLEEISVSEMRQESLTAENQSPTIV